MRPERAYIQVDEWNDRIDFTFNPDKLSLIMANNWSQQPAQGRRLPRIGFGGGKPTILKVTLVFDGTEVFKDVREETDKLVKLMKIGQHRNEAFKAGKAGKGGKGGGPPKNPRKRPPTCTFVWGKILTFEAALTSLNLDYVLFASQDGTPLRANAVCTFTQMVEEDEFLSQNPTSGGRTGERVHWLGPRETLDQVAYEAFGSTALWRGLAAFNDIDDPLRIRAGDQLLLPPSPDDLKAFS
jgi:hypothetical protein